MEKYALEESKLIIKDEEIRIDIEEDFFLPSFGKKYNECDVVVKRDKKVKEVFFEKDNKKFGEKIVLYENGVIASSCFYLYDELHGPSTFYSKDKKILSITWFYKGKREGKSKRYYSSGKIYCIERYKDNLMEGEQKYLYENGRCRSMIYYKKGILCKKALLYWDNGNIKREVDFEEGRDNIYDEEGSLIYEKK